MDTAFVTSVDDLVKKVKSLAYLEDGWDGYDEGTITPAAIEAATRLLYQLTDKHRLPEYVFPEPGGGVSLEWRSSSGHFTQLYIDTDSDGLYRYLAVSDDDMVEKDDIDIDRALALILEVS